MGACNAGVQQEGAARCLTPREKYPFPITSAHEVGWFLATPRSNNGNTPRTRGNTPTPRSRNKNIE